MAHLLNLLGLLLTSAGVVLAFKALKDGKEMMGNLRDVFNSLTTHRVGESPGYVDEVTKLVHRAKVSVEITAILPGIGYFSSPPGWVD